MLKIQDSRNLHTQTKKILNNFLIKGKLILKYILLAILYILNQVISLENLRKIEKIFTELVHQMDGCFVSQQKSKFFCWISFINNMRILILINNVNVWPFVYANKNFRCKRMYCCQKSSDTFFIINTEYFYLDFFLLNDCIRTKNVFVKFKTKYHTLKGEGSNAAISKLFIFYQFVQVVWNSF